MATAKRRRDEPDDDGFTLVLRERFRVKRPPSPQQSGATASERTIPVWRIVKHDDFPGPYQLVRWLECELQLALKVDVSASGEFLLRGATWDAAAALQVVADYRPRGIVLARREPSRRGVLVGYPTGLPLDPVLEHPLVETVVRCSYNAGLNRHLPTRQVQLTLRGHVPAALDLGCFGTFAVRRFIQEPVRCYHCQAFGHYQRQCQRRQELCGVCSGEHASRDCVRHLRERGERPVARCPNCGARHHAWNRRCPARSGRFLGPRYLASPLPSLVENGTQMTGRHYTFKVNALLSLLGTYEFLVSQESVAVRSRISHQPAFSYVRQALRAGRAPGVRLPTERPIAMPVFRHHREESDWMSYVPTAGSH
ncbi:hypothetical protein GWK47_035258 [Chionoecetes opilio]|uniref:CCHC-type domain-containing protein n=1 Tax=Chionoecetes opilio TaxID=41210 RepID=A0A8J4YU39_CHIOP|nr:hypothetical protein GWK47_035258 [Chionoecetes opilio]